MLNYVLIGDMLKQGNLEKKQVFGENTVNLSDARKRAYLYICENLKKIPGGLNSLNTEFISLDDLLLIKNGLHDPSPQMVACFMTILRSVASESEIHSYLVAPFEENRGSSVDDKH